MYLPWKNLDFCSHIWYSSRSKESKLLVRGWPRNRSRAHHRSVAAYPRHGPPDLGILMLGTSSKPKHGILTIRKGGSGFEIWINHNTSSKSVRCESICFLENAVFFPIGVHHIPMYIYIYLCLYKSWECIEQMDDFSGSWQIVLGQAKGSDLLSGTSQSNTLPHSAGLGGQSCR